MKCPWCKKTPKLREASDADGYVIQMSCLKCMYVRRFEYKSAIGMDVARNRATDEWNEWENG